MIISDYLANALLNHTFRNSAYTAPSTVYVALFTAIPVKQTAGPSGEVSGGSYARQAVTFGAAANGRVLNSAAVTFPAPTADWAAASGPIVAVALMDANSSGNFLVAVPVCPRVVVNGDQPPKFDIGGLKVLFDQLGGC